MTNLFALPLDVMLTGLEHGLTIRLIASVPFQECAAADDVAEVLSRESLFGFDHIPVRQSGRIVGVLARRDGPVAGSVESNIRRLHDGMLVSADEAIERLLPCMRSDEYRLVVIGSEVKGIVTRSDLLKLPVRILAFTLVTHLESLMAQVISRSMSFDRWQMLLGEKRRRKLCEELEELRSDSLDPNPIELTTMSEKETILREAVVFDPSFVDGASKVRKLRNDVNHIRDYAGNRKKLEEFLEIMDLARNLIRQVETWLEQHPDPSATEAGRERSSRT